MKKRVQKLHLHRETLRHLNAMALGDVVGGVTTTCPETVTCDITCGLSCNGTCRPCTGTQC